MSYGGLIIVNDSKRYIIPCRIINIMTIANKPLYPLLSLRYISFNKFNTSYVPQLLIKYWYIFQYILILIRLYIQLILFLLYERTTV